MDEATAPWPKEVLKDLIEGKLDAETLRRVHTHVKHADRFEKMLEIEQARVPWKDRIVAPLAEHLYVVAKGEHMVVKCFCGHEFGDHSQNWKLSALIYERNPGDSEVYLGPRAADPSWAVLREYYCPGCATQLEVEAVPPMYPIAFDARLDIEGFYSSRPELMRKVFGK